MSFQREFQSSADENLQEVTNFQNGGTAAERDNSVDLARAKAAKAARKSVSRHDSPYDDTNPLLAQSNRPEAITTGSYNGDEGPRTGTSSKFSITGLKSRSGSFSSQISEKAQQFGGLVRRASQSFQRKMSTGSSDGEKPGFTSKLKEMEDRDVERHAALAEADQQENPHRRSLAQKQWLCHRYVADFPSDKALLNESIIEHHFAALAQHRLWDAKNGEREPLRMTRDEQKQAERGIWPPLVADPTIMLNAPAPEVELKDRPESVAAQLARIKRAAAKTIKGPGESSSKFLATLRTNVGLPEKQLRRITSLSPDFTDMNIPADMMTACGWEQDTKWEGKGCGKMPEKALTEGQCETCANLPVPSTPHVRHVTGTAPKSPPDDANATALYMKIAGRKKLRKVRETLYGGFSGNPFRDESSGTDLSSREDGSVATSDDEQCTRRESFWNAPQGRKSRAPRRRDADDFASARKESVLSPHQPATAPRPLARSDRRSMSVDIAFMPPKRTDGNTASRTSRSGSLPALRGQVPNDQASRYDGPRDSEFYDFYDELLALYGIELGDSD